VFRVCSGTCSGFTERASVSSPSFCSVGQYLLSSCAEATSTLPPCLPPSLRRTFACRTGTCRRPRQPAPDHLPPQLSPRQMGNPPAKTVQSEVEFSR